MHFRIQMLGMEVLHVMDASVMPRLVSGNLNATAQIVAERAWFHFSISSNEVKRTSNQRLQPKIRKLLTPFPIEGCAVSRVLNSLLIDI